jgi:hypothetical protein
MKRMPILLLFAVLAWPGSDKTLLLAQETPQPPITPSSEETTRNLNEPPTPQFMQFEVDLGAGGPSIRMRVHPAWQALYKPYVRVGRARTEPQIEEETASPPSGGAEELQQVLEHALDRAKPPAAPAP